MSTKTVSDSRLRNADSFGIVMSSKLHNQPYHSWDVNRWDHVSHPCVCNFQCHLEILGRLVPFAWGDHDTHATDDAILAA